MANASVNTVRLIDSDGDALDDGSGRLNVNAVLSASDNIEIGNVDIKLNGTAVSGGADDVDAGTLRVTIADDDNHFGAIGTAADSDGTIHGQLRYIGDVFANMNSFLSAIDVDTGNIYSSINYPLKILGSGTYSEGSDKATAIAAVRNDTLAALADTDNEYAPLQVNAEGALYVADDSHWGTIGTAADSDGTAHGQLRYIAEKALNLVAINTSLDNIESFTSGITGIASDDNDTVGTSAEKISGADGDVACKRVDIMAHPDNTGYIWVGDSAVSVDGLNGGIRLAPGDFYSIDIDNTGDVYAIATVNAENVCFNYFT
tara:strand:+ start:453 stop:1403 length:951 start_codon:yes stop_codon:yes gene_type:complete